jgi:hypothetical protein
VSSELTVRRTNSIDLWSSFQRVDRRMAATGRSTPSRPRGGWTWACA